MDEHMTTAWEEAKRGLEEGGIPIGSVLVVGGRVVGRGHNRRVQGDSSVLHAEMDCLENAGRLTSKDYGRSVLYSTLSPCDMCAGAVLLYKIPKVVVGENVNFKGAEEHMRKRGVEVEVLNHPAIIEFFRNWVDENPELWNEDIGE
ncbi:MAG: nucleoside deaminase [Candidatus Altiarchaeales archaeon]|nr:nucleoside deaminase [Candidatus Altiarchaeales archaeon]MBD3416456.1 nucleoside deaminase [Candidatus Altiarchaeales archaeon]